MPTAQTLQADSALTPRSSLSTAPGLGGSAPVVQLTHGSAGVPASIAPAVTGVMSRAIADRAAATAPSTVLGCRCRDIPILSWSAAMSGEDLVVGEAHGPDVRCGSGGDAGQSASLPGTWAWHRCPGAAVPAHDQRLLPGAGEVGAHCQGAGCRAGGDRGQVIAGSRVRAGHQLPGTAVPVLDQCPVAGAGGVRPHRPYVARRGAGDPDETRVAYRVPWVRAGHACPLRAVPVLDQGLGRAGG